MIFEHTFLTFNVEGISHPGKFNGKPKFGRQISAPLYWVTGANERNSYEITESGPDMDGKRSWWGVLVIHCGLWILVIRSNQAKTQFLLTAVELE